MTSAETAAASLSYCGKEARRHDNERFLMALFAPAAAQEALFALLVFNQEIARTREVVSEPVLGQMRLQWWRDAVGACYGDGPLPHHPVVEPLAAAVRGFALPQGLFEQLIDAREADLDDAPPATLRDLEAYAENTAAPLQRLALHVLGVGGDADPIHEAAHEAAAHAATAYALTGILRSTAMLARRGRVLLPAALLEKHGCRQRSVLEGEQTPELAACVAEVATLAQQRLDQARGLRRQIPKAARPALLPAVLAGLGLKRLKQAGYAPFSSEALMPSPWRHIAIAWAAFSGRY